MMLPSEKSKLQVGDKCNCAGSSFKDNIRKKVDGNDSEKVSIITKASATGHAT